MRHLQLAELRGSWSTWAGVSVALVVTNFALALSALTLVSGVRAMRTGTVDVLDSTAYVFTPAENLFFCALVGAVVIAGATGMVLNARRGALARLALAGATPAQIAVTAMVQLTVVSLASSILGAAAALLALEPTLGYLALERLEAGDPMPVAAPVYSPWPVLGAALLAVGVALVGGLRQILASSRVAPVEALREHARDGQVIAMTAWRWVGVGVAGLAIAAGYASIAAFTAEPDKETISNLLIASMTVLVLAAVALALLAPVVVGPLARAWTSVVPTRSPSWQLARRTVSARATRLTRSVVPVMMTIGLLWGLLAQWGSLEGILLANGFDIEPSAAGPATLLIFLGRPLTISLAGGVGSLIMMSRQRDAELALLGIVGATPRQRLLVPALEALIITITGLVMALVMVALALGVLAIGILAAGMSFALALPLGMFVLTLAVALTVTVAATVVPTTRALHQAEPGVIARLVAD